MVQALLPLWVLYDGSKIGTLRQCEALVEGLVEALPFTPTYIPIHLSGWRRYMPVQAGLFLPATLLAPNIPATPKPALIIAAGRQAATVALALKGKAPRIALLSPRVNPRHFELVLAPVHDGLMGDNVISYPGALHRINSSINADFPPPPEAFISLLLGGNSKHHTYTAADINRLCDQIKHLRTLPAYQGARLLITPSRRTPPTLLALLKQQLGADIAQLWDGTGENPYRRYLAWAKAIVVTGDSINMMAEACGLGKPVFIFELPTARGGKLARFGHTLLTGGHAQPLHAPDVTAAFRALHPWAAIKERTLSAIQKLMPDR